MGDEVVQLYVRDMEASVKRPLQQLHAFQRVHFQAGETKNVKLTLPVADLAYFDTIRQEFVVEPGEFEIRVGAAADDIRLYGRLGDRVGCY